MNIAKVDSILLKHPYLKNMPENDRIKIYNEVYTKIFRIRSDITIINRVQYSVFGITAGPLITADRSIKLHHQFLQDLNLSAHKDVDYLMEQSSLLKNLTDEQKIVIFEIAAYRINMYRTLKEQQEYFFSTHKEDNYYTVKRFLEPIVNVTSRILTVVTKSFIYKPLLAVTASVLSLLSETKFYAPALSVASRIWALTSQSNNYVPMGNATFSIYFQGPSGDSPITQQVYLPKLVIEHLLVLSKTREYTYNSLLSNSFKVVITADYFDEGICDVLLEMTFQVTT